MPHPVSSDNFPQLTVTEKDNNILIVYRWFAPWSVWSVVLGTGVLSYAFFIDQTLSDYTWRLLGHPQQGRWAWMGLAALWLAIQYVPLAHLLNRTAIRIRDDRLTVRHGPLPWPGGRTLPWNNIKQVYVKKNRNTRQIHSPYALHVACADRRDVRLAGGFANKDLPYFIRTKLAQHLAKRTVRD